MTERETQIAEEPFRQVDSSLSKTAYGMGLGLTLSKLMVIPPQINGTFE
jgi:hypothetical protein